MFNSLGSSSNFARAGKSAADDLVRSFAASRRNAPKYDEMAETAVKIRSKEKIAAMKAEQEVALQGIRAKADVKTNQLETDSKLEYSMAKRKAGALAAAGKLFGDAGQFLGEKRELREVGSSDADYQGMIDDNTESIKDLDQQLADLDAGKDVDTSDGEPTTTNTDGDEGGQQIDLDGDAPVNSRLVSPSVSAQHTAQGKLGKDAILSMAKQVGFSDEAARTVVGIAGGESGYDPTNSTIRSGLHAKTGEDSVGLMQINWGYHKDKGWLQQLGITKREDLLDPVKNLKAAKYLYDGRGGGFQDWTVYNKGIYRDFM